MRKIFVLAVFACFAAMNVNAQTEGTESKNEEMDGKQERGDATLDESGRREPHGLEGPI